MKAALKRFWNRLWGRGEPTPEPAKAALTESQLKVLSCLKGRRESDPLVAAIRHDLEDKSSVLELMRSYLQELEGELDNNAPTFNKLAKLFRCGLTPDRVEGHHYGIAVAIRTGEQEDVLADYSNLLGFLWSTSLGKVPPWVGKSFALASHGELRHFTDGHESGQVPTYHGVNHFNEVEDSPLNFISILFLSFWLHLKDAPEEERARYGYEKKGGFFIARRAPSVYPASRRQVFQLNYRWEKLDNPPPLRYLIDEIVEISDGLYLGQLLFATRNLLGDYDPELPHAQYGYEHFGYFILMDERWREEARRVFPYLGVPYEEKRRLTPRPRKFTEFTFSDPPDGNCSDKVLAEVRSDLRGRETIIDLMKFYSDELMTDPRADSPYFARLSEIFNRGIALDEMRGFYRGALVSFQGDGLLNLFNLNQLNVVWGAARFFTPWTGKIFEEATPRRLQDITEGYETGEVPTFWGANTDSLRTSRKRIAGMAMRVFNIWTEEANNYEKRNYGFDLKSFFFIARLGTSVNRDNRGKRIFLINYRWPKLRTFPPDCFCMDEVVQIAEGLYLGQLNYATELLKEYDPREDPMLYKHRCFGYFLLMDDDWHRRRLKIGFDLDNI